MTPLWRLQAGKIKTGLYSERNPSPSKGGTYVTGEGLIKKCAEGLVQQLVTGASHNSLNIQRTPTHTQVKTAEDNQGDRALRRFNYY